MIARYLLALSVLAACAGCASTTAPVTYYLLTPSAPAAETGAQREDRPTLVIENVELSEYLRQSGLILQSGDNRLTVSRSHLWAERLDEALPKALLRELQRQSQDYAFYLKSTDYVSRTDYRLRLQVENLQATDRGEVVTSGRFQLIPGMGAARPVSADFLFRRDLDQDGYAHAVERLQVLVGQIAQAVLNSLNEMAANAPAADSPQPPSAEPGAGH